MYPVLKNETYYAFFIAGPKVRHLILQSHYNCEVLCSRCYEDVEVPHRVGFGAGHSGCFFFFQSLSTATNLRVFNTPLAESTATGTRAIPAPLARLDLLLRPPTERRDKGLDQL